MHVASALRRKRDEIASTIAAYEARIEAAKMDLAALEQAARLLDPQAGRDAAAIHREFGRLAKRQETPTAECAVWVSERHPPWIHWRFPSPGHEDLTMKPPVRSNPLAFASLSLRRSHIPRRRRREDTYRKNFFLESPVTH
jgi:hypothetical protein